MYSRYPRLLNLVEGLYAISSASNSKYVMTFYIEIYRRLLVSSYDLISN